jgi:hypothetical protein
MIIDEIDKLKEAQRKENERVQEMLSGRTFMLNILKWTPTPLGRDVRIVYPIWGKTIRLELNKWPLEMACCWCGELSILAGEFTFNAPKGQEYTYYNFKDFEVVCYFDTSVCRWEGSYRYDEVEVKIGYDNRKLVC